MVEDGACSKLLKVVAGERGGGVIGELEELEEGLLAVLFVVLAQAFVEEEEGSLLLLVVSEVDVLW